MATAPAAAPAAMATARATAAIRRLLGIKSLLIGLRVILRGAVRD